VTFASIYVDESGSHAGAPFLCLAGFLYEGEHAEQLAAGWRAILDREFIALIKQHRTLAFAAGVNEVEYNKVYLPYKTKEPYPAGAYSFCLTECVRMIMEWANARRVRGDIAYVFVGTRQPARS